MSVDRDTVDHIAELARLRLDDDEREEMTAQLATIVEYVAQLETVDVSDVPPTASVASETGTALRDDEPRPCLPRERALENAPDTDEGHFLVPRVLPDDREEPDDSDEPAEPGTSDASAQPDDSDEPAEPDDPDDPNEPDEPAEPDE